MREKFGVTSAVITHDMVSDAFDIADQIAMLIKGRVVAQGTGARCSVANEGRAALHPPRAASKPRAPVAPAT